MAINRHFICVKLGPSAIGCKKNIIEANRRHTEIINNTKKYRLEAFKWQLNKNNRSHIDVSIIYMLILYCCHENIAKIEYFVTWPLVSIGQNFQK